MNKPLFKINRIGAQDDSPTYDKILSLSILKDIANRLYGVTDFDVNWIEERNTGRLITCEYNEKISFINLSQEGTVRGRNYYFQSVCTAYGIYLNFKNNNTEYSDISFFFYFLPFTGENKTKYHKFIYRVMITAGLHFLNADYGLIGFVPTPFTSVKTIINARNELRYQNSANQSTFVTDEADGYHIYGKTYGANQKETILMCLAISAIADKTVFLYQVVDHNTDKISRADLKTIELYSDINGHKPIVINEDSYDYSDDIDVLVDENLRSSRFTFNLLQKYGSKKCVLCDCCVDSVVQGAHIYPIADIKKRDDLSSHKRSDYATNGNNGLWLCANHHKLYDRNYIWFDADGQVHISDSISEEIKEYIKSTILYYQIPLCYMNNETSSFIQMRLNSY